MYVQSGGERVEGEIGRGKLSKVEVSGGGDDFAREGRDG